ncbi:MAG: ACP phosphodiesterase [Flavobacteriaceae bacterium]
MNFLAHIYLSGNDEGVIIGNFIADGIKGKKYEAFPPSIQKGILLHRAIDSFTDQHPMVKQSTARLHKNYGHYSGVIVDILYDHFLARNWAQYHKTPLSIYVDNFYDLLRKNFEMLPSRIQRMMPIMISQNWLLSYESAEGIARILSQMNIRTKGKSKMNLAILELEQYDKEFEEEFTSFFSELIAFTENKRSQL